MDPPDRPGGLSPDVAGAVSVSRSDATRRTYSGQWRQFVAWADDAGIPWLLTAPVDVAEYLTALVGAGRRPCNGAARRCPSCPPGYVRRSEDRLSEPRSRPRAGAGLARRPVGCGRCGLILSNRWGPPQPWTTDSSGRCHWFPRPPRRYSHTTPSPSASRMYW